MLSPKQIATVLSITLLFVCESVGAAPAPPVIFSVVFASGTNQITIKGSNLSPTGLSPAIAFDGASATVVSFTNSMIVVKLPSTSTPAGTYLLTVTDPAVPAQPATFNVTIAAVTPPDVDVSGINGVREFLANGTFKVPAGIKHVMVRLWGGGGPGEDSSACQANVTPFAGGGGAYSRGVIAVTPGATYTVVVGDGGLVDGPSGGDSQILDAKGNVLIFAGGGQGATAGAGGGRADSSAAISHPGYPATGVTLNDPGNSWLQIITPITVSGSADSNNLDFNTYGGTVGEGGFCEAAPGGGSGQSGYVLIEW